MHYDPVEDRIIALRNKEAAQDYRYFPEPDLPMLVVNQERISHLAGSMPELPEARRLRLIKSYNLTPYDAALISEDLDLYNFFTEAVQGEARPKTVANFISGELSRLANEAGVLLSASKVKPFHLQFLALEVDQEFISVMNAKKVIQSLWDEGGDPKSIIETHHLKQVSDFGFIDQICDSLFIECASQVAEYRSGKEKLLGFLVGQALKKSQGQANPSLLKDRLMQKLKGEV